MANDDSGRELPRYRILDAAGFFADNNTLYPQGTEITWLGCPNELMEPMNPAASERSEAYLEQLDKSAELKRRLDSGTFQGRSIDLGDQVLNEMLQRPKMAKRQVRHADNVPPRPDMATREQKRAALANTQVREVSTPSSVRAGGRSAVQNTLGAPPGPMPILGTTYTSDASRDAR